MKRRHDSLTTVPPSPSVSLSERAQVQDEKKVRREASPASLPSPNENKTSDLPMHTCERNHTHENHTWTFQQVKQYFTLFLGDLAPEYMESLAKHKFVSKVQRSGTLSNKRIHVGVSIRGNDSSPSSLSSGCSSTDTEEGMFDKEDSIRSSQKPSLSSSSSSELKQHSMLGLYSGDTFQPGECVTLYGGIQFWAGPGKGSIKERPTHFNTHVRRLPRSDSVLDGRPWSMLFPRIFSLCKDKAMMKPVVTPHSLINLLLLLQHEAVHHPVQTPSLDGIYSHNTANKNIWCTRCAAEIAKLALLTQMNTLQSDLQDNLSRQEILQFLNPVCNICKTQVCMLPCEVDVLLSTWSSSDRDALEGLCQQVISCISSAGLGYMANTDRDKSAWNVRVMNTNPYIMPLV